MKIAATVEFWWIPNSKLLNIWKGGKTRSILADSNQSLSASLTSRRSPTKIIIPACIVSSLVHSDYLAAVRLNNIPLEMYFAHLTTMTLSVHSLSQHFGCIWLWNVNSDGILEVGTRFCYPSYGSNTNSLCKNLILNILLYKLSFSRSKPYHLIHIILSIHWWLSLAVSGYWYHAIFANSHLLAGVLII